MPKISVIIPVYKAQSYVGRCLDSILSQTFQDFEIIAVDDGSPDASYDICLSYARKDSRIRLLRQENGGQASARNLALQSAQGQWICFVDSDDLIHPQMLEFLVRAVEESGAAVSGCAFLEAEAVPENYLADREFAYTIYSMDDAGLCDLYDRDLYPGWVACTKLIRRDLVESYPFTAGRVYEDNEAVCRWICQAGKFAWIGQDLYFYRTNLSSTTQSDFSLKKLDYLWALESITRFYCDQGYAGMHERFGSRYLDAAAHACYGARHILDRPDVANAVNRQTWRFIREQKLKPTRQQLDALVDAAYPKLTKLYWPAIGLVRTLKDEGLRGVAAKLRKRDGV